MCAVLKPVVSIVSVSLSSGFAGCATGAKLASNAATDSVTDPRLPPTSADAGAFNLRPEYAHAMNVPAGNGGRNAAGTRCRCSSVAYRLVSAPLLNGPILTC